MRKYKICLCDPPWEYRVFSKKDDRRTANSHYPTMKLSDLCALDVPGITDTSSALFLWTTMPQIPAALELMEAWQFRYVTVAFTWVKRNVKSGSYFFGLGHYTRANAELCLLGLRGRLERKSTRVHQIIDTPIEQHSKKPDVAREKIVELFGDIPRIELFARQRVPGWDAWGNEVHSDIILESRHDK